MDKSRPDETPIFSIEKKNRTDETHFFSTDKSRPDETPIFSIEKSHVDEIPIFFY